MRQPDTPRTLDGVEPIRAAGIELATQARRELLLFGPGLAPELYDHEDFLGAVQRLALERPDQPVRILVGETREARRHGHRLIELARRLTSRIAIRRCAEDDRERTDAFLVVDARGYLYRHHGAAYSAELVLGAAAEARRLREEFIQMWERSDSDPEVARLHL
ncbi:hypothetical protein [Marichromatium bheemlicum]|uniref:DUF7931 domain-containing protein n=1 Tax=Marichromatium bheemlicum TaxID=365339 RepID=A0ABX1I325_9GAMM|nr:hypothetical protein [Marichromatium bheemlicum]NKN31637.1 hypothetical protein [Marichromatium bheemlicum]